MKNKVDVHVTLFLLFKRYGVPTNIVMGGSKEQTLGSFRNKIQEADCHINQTDPYPP